MGFSLLTGSLAAHLLGPSGRGQLAAIQLWPLFIASIGSAGILEAVGYFCGKRPEQSGAIAVTALAMLAGLAVPMTLLGVLAMPRLLAAESPHVVWQAQVYMSIVPLLFVLNVPLAALRGRGDLRLWNVLRLTIPAGYACILLLSPFLAYSRVTIVAFGMLVWTGLHLVLAGWLVVRRLPGPHAVRPALVGPLGRFGGLAVGGVAPSWLNARLDQLVIAAFLPAHQLGLYAVGVSWSMAVTPLSNSFTQVVLPRLAGSASAEEAAQRLGQSSRLATLASLLSGVTLLAVTPLAVFVLFGPAFLPALPATLVLVVAATILSMNQFLEEALRGLGRPGFAAVAQTLGLVVTAPGLYLLLPRLGILGAALASLLSYAAVLLVLALALRSIGMAPAELFLPRAGEVVRLLDRLGVSGSIRGLSRVP